MLDSVIAALQDPQIWILISVGFIGQMCDGALGMGFGAVSSTALAALGMPREVASAAINGAKIFTGTASSASHLWLRNIDGRMLLWLAMAGGLGGYVGAHLLTNYHSRWIGISVSAYLLLVGAYILWRAFSDRQQRISSQLIGGVGLAGGLLEALAGVWGPLVTSNLVAMGVKPRFAVGTGNVAETFVAVVVFTVLLQKLGWPKLSMIVIALIAGAVIAAPIGARLTRRLSHRVMMIAVGVLVMLLSALRLARDLL